MQHLPARSWARRHEGEIRLGGTLTRSVQQTKNACRKRQSRLHGKYRPIVPNRERDEPSRSENLHFYCGDLAHGSRCHVSLAQFCRGFRGKQRSSPSHNTCNALLCRCRLKRYGPSSANSDVPWGRGQSHSRYTVMVIRGRLIVATRYQRSLTVTKRHRAAQRRR
jgi:hypothetical protein